jgi:hypothetical protein
VIPRIGRTAGFLLEAPLIAQRCHSSHPRPSIQLRRYGSQTSPETSNQTASPGIPSFTLYSGRTSRLWMSAASHSASVAQTEETALRFERVRRAEASVRSRPGARGGVRRAAS